MEQFTRYLLAILAHKLESKTESDRLTTTRRPFAYPTQQFLWFLLSKEPIVDSFTTPADTPDTLSRTDSNFSDILDILDTLDTFDIVDIPDTPDTPDTLDTL